MRGTSHRITIGALTTIPLVLVMLAGCNWLLHVDDYYAVPEDAALSPGMESGDDAGSSDAPGPGAVACGSTLPVGTADFRQLVRSCFLHAGCSAFNYYGGLNIGRCIAEDSLQAFGGTRCERAAQNCSDIEACNGEGWATECDGGGAAAWCDDQNNARTCVGANNSPAPGWYNDCTRRGGTCRVYQDEAGVHSGCVVAGCNDPNDGMLRCAGDNLYTCIGDAGYGENCRQFQATCSTAGGGNCYYGGPACTDVEAGPCRGNVGQVCFGSTNQRADFPCGSSGLTCVPAADPVSGHPFTCLAPGCDAGACLEHCMGDVASVCVGGATLTFDCRSIGMYCQELLTDQRNVYLAQCSPFTQF